ncbi:MAG: ABC transporter permease [Xanthobacteraceae bacterium]
MTSLASEIPAAGEKRQRDRAAAQAFRYALRELRGGLSGFYVFIACIALGVFAIAGVGTLSTSLTDSLEREGRTLLGGDAAFSLIQREASAAELAFLRTQGQVSTVSTMRGMVRAQDGRLALVELKSVDDNYPTLGKIKATPDLPMRQLLDRRDGAFGAAADGVLLARLGLIIGDRVTVGTATFEIRTLLSSEPDKLAGGVGLGPRFLIGEEGLRASGLIQPGSLIRWIYRVKLPDNAASEAAVEKLTSAVRAELPDAGWEIRSRGNASPQLERNISRFTQFLTLVGLAALLVGGVGVANAVKSHLDRKRDVIATLKALGATGDGVFTIYLVQILVVALIGALIGLAIGAMLPFAVVGAFGSLLPLPIEPAVHPTDLLLSLVYGLLTALAFALWPLGRVHDVPVATLFRETTGAEWSWPRRRYLVMMAVVLALLIAIAVTLAYDKRIALIFIGASAAVFLLLRLIALGVMAGARRLPRPRMTLLRMAIANIHRPGALTPSVILSLGLGLTVLVTITQIDRNLQRQFTASLPERAPSFFFVDIPSADGDRFDAFLRTHVTDAKIERVPMLRGRIVEARGLKPEELKPSPDAAWVLQSDRGLTYTSEMPAGSKLVEGEWWGPDYRGAPLVSFEKKLADGLGLKLGDSVTVNVLGRNVTAKIANMRTVDWQNLGINFVLVFSPDAFRGAPHTHIATLTEPTSTAESDAAIIKAVADAFPSVTSVRVREALQMVGDVVTNLVLAIRGSSAVTLLAAILVLGGALAAGHRHRVYDAVILKTLGATRNRLLGAYALEYLLIGLATAVFGVLSGSVAAWLIVTRLMNLSFAWDGVSAALVVAGALAVTIGIGLAGTLLALNQKPAPILRNL